MTDKKTQDGWTIQSRQLGVAGLGGHNYLALVDPQGVVRQEIHGWMTEDDKLSFTFIDRDDLSDDMKEKINDVGKQPAVKGAEVNVPLNGRSVWDMWAGALTSAMSHHKQAEYSWNGARVSSVDGARFHNSNGFWSAVLGDIGVNWEDVEPDSWLRTTPGKEYPLPEVAKGPKFANEKISPNMNAATDAWAEVSAYAVGDHVGLSKDQSVALAQEAKQKGADWWAAALASEADRLMNDAEYAPRKSEQTGNNRLPEEGIQLAMTGALPSGFFGDSTPPAPGKRDVGWTDSDFNRFTKALSENAKRASKPVTPDKTPNVAKGVPTYGKGGAVQGVKEAEKRADADPGKDNKYAPVSGWNELSASARRHADGVREMGKSRNANRLSQGKNTTLGSSPFNKAGEPEARAAERRKGPLAALGAAGNDIINYGEGADQSKSASGGKKEPFSNGTLGKGPDGRDDWFTPNNTNRSVTGKPSGIERAFNSLFGNATNWAGHGSYYSGDDGGSHEDEDGGNNDDISVDGAPDDGIYHVGGVVSDDDPVINEDIVAVTAQEGEFVLSRAALSMLGEELVGRVNGALRTGNRETIARLRGVLNSRLGGHDALPEADIKASMNERPYWDQNDPGHTSAHARVAREFRVAFPGHSDMDKAEHIGGMITDHDPDTCLDDYKIDIPEGAFVVSRVATKLAGLPALMRLNALAEGNDAALAATLKRELEAALGIQRPTTEAELKAMMHDPRYTDAQHPEHTAYRQMIANGFRAALPG
ncbi:MAG: hypothetical protein HN403_13435 [Rhodospirillales bacterium]|jgi:hypothetical protein|nr:hypothetical protein [Rhodospirillales bacterium]